jgi:hypothetical protein
MICPLGPVNDNLDKQLSVLNKIRYFIQTPYFLYTFNKLSLIDQEIVLNLIDYNDITNLLKYVKSCNSDVYFMKLKELIPLAHRLNLSITGLSKDEIIRKITDEQDRRAKDFK